MKIWLTQRAEPTPHDLGEKRRPMRTGLMAEYLAEKGESVLWWTGDFDHYGRRQRQHQNHAIPVSANYHIKYLQAEGYQKSYSFKRLKYDWTVARKFFDAARHENPPDVILASMPSVDLALESVRYGKEHDIPVIVDVRDLHPDVFVETASAFLKPTIYTATRPMARKLRQLLVGATAIWGNSDSFVEWGCNKAGRPRCPLDITLPITYKRVEIDPDEERRYLEDFQAEGFFYPNSINIVFFGTLSRSFDFKPAFDAAKALNASQSSCQFHFFGVGELQPMVEGKCAELPNCHYHGSVGAHRLQAVMSAATIGLAPYVPSDNFKSNMPNKPTEYLGGGLAVAISFEEGILPAFLKENGAGFCYADGADLAKKLKQLSDRPSELNEIRKAALKAFQTQLDYKMLSERMWIGIRDVVEAYDVKG